VPNCNLSAHCHAVLHTNSGWQNKKKYNFKETLCEQNKWCDDGVRRGPNAATWSFTCDKCNDKRQRSERFSFIEIDIQM